MIVPGRSTTDTIPPYVSNDQSGGTLLLSRYLLEINLYFPDQGRAHNRKNLLFLLHFEALLLLVLKLSERNEILFDSRIYSDTDYEKDN